jgi:hypothetical protein
MLPLPSLFTGARSVASRSRRLQVHLSVRKQEQGGSRERRIAIQWPLRESRIDLLDGR